MFTSCFSSLKEIPEGLEPVAISRGVPVWFRGRRELRLAPHRSWLRMSQEGYLRHYSRLLDRLNAHELYDELGPSAVLLCWERPGVRCHRRLVADWFKAELGITVPEIGLSACPPFAELPAKGEVATLKALSVKQPAASEIASGAKRIEYRSWPTRHRGPLLIVASRRPVVGDLPSGVTVCLVRLVGCRPDPDEPGLWEWLLEDPRPVKPVAISGRLGLYNVPLAAAECL